MPSQHKEPDDLDSPWKKRSNIFSSRSLALCFPEVHAAIDWTRGYQSLDKELQKITSDAAVGKRLADKLFKVWRADGKEAWLLIHVEVQGQRERKFAERMFKYYHRILDRYDRPVVSLAVLCDERRSWRPDRFVYNNLGCDLDFRFPMVKLIDYRRDEAVSSILPIRLRLLSWRSSRFSKRGMRPRRAGNGNFDWSRVSMIAGSNENRFGSFFECSTGCWPFRRSSSRHSESTSSDLRRHDACLM